VRRIQSIAAILLATITMFGQHRAAREDASTDGRDKSLYQARTDREAVPYSTAPPALGPAGSTIHDPSFGSRILRVTDGHSDPSQPGQSLFTPSSSEQNSWNKTSTMFYVSTAGGSFLLYRFDPESMKVRRADSSTLSWGPEPQFSFTQPNVLYGVNRRDLIFQQYDTTTKKLSDVNRISKCAKVRPSDFAGSPTVSADDTRFMTSIGPTQDRHYLIYVYDKTQGCRWYNTQTGEVGGGWGPKGTIPAEDRFLVHNARMSKSGKFVYMTPSGAGGGRKTWAVWQIDTMIVGFCRLGCAGHHVLGYSHIVGPSNMAHPLDLWLRPLDRLDATTPLLSKLEPLKNYWYDSHYSWNNVDANDTAPVCFSTYRPTNPDSSEAPPQVNGPWENEIDCAATDGKNSTVWRFAHTYSTARNGFWSQPRGNVSQDGRFFMFTSDWQDRLGRDAKGRFRTDVFVVELR